MTALKLIVSTVGVVFFMSLSPVITDLAYNLIYDRYEQAVNGPSYIRLIFVNGAWYILGYPIVVFIVSGIVQVPTELVKYIFIIYAAFATVIFLAQMLFTDVSFSFNMIIILLIFYFYAFAMGNDDNSN